MIFQFSFSVAQFHVFTWGWQVTMEENTTTWWAVQFLTQQQATHCTCMYAHKDRGADKKTKQKATICKLVLGHYHNNINMGYLI